MDKRDFRKQMQRKMKRQKAVMTIAYVVIAILVGASIFWSFYDTIDDKAKGNFVNYLPQLIFLLIVFCMMLVAATRLSKQMKKDVFPEPKLSCGRGPDRGAESLPSDMGSGEHFYIKKVVFEISVGNVFRILNENGNKILEAKLGLSGLGSYNVKNNRGECIATIRHSGIVTNVSQFEVRIGNEEPFTLRQMVGVGVCYEINGLDYDVQGDMSRTNFNIMDMYGKTVARMGGRPLENGWVDGNESEVIMAPGAENNIYILLLTLCLFIEKESKEEREERRYNDW